MWWPALPLWKEGHMTCKRQWIGQDGVLNGVYIYVVPISQSFFIHFVSINIYSFLVCSSNFCLSIIFVQFNLHYFGQLTNSDGSKINLCCFFLKQKPRAAFDWIELVSHSNPCEPLHSNSLVVIFMI